MAKKKFFTDASLSTFINEIKSYITNLLATKANASHTHTISNVTNLQSALDGKASSSHNHSTSNITSGTLSSDRLPTVPVSKGGTGATTAAQALTNLGLTATSTELNVLDGITATTAELNYTDGVTGNIQTQLNAKQTTITGGASTITGSNLTANRALISNSSGKVAVSAVTSTELGYLDGVTSNLQTQLDGKSGTSHTHNYAGSSSVGGSAKSAVKLDTSTAGDSNTPVYFSGGKPVACTSLDLNTSGSSASCTGNSATATKLATSRTIGLGTSVTGTATSFDGSANITIPVTDVKEAYLSWGGKSLSGSVSPIDAASSNIHSANRFAFAKPAGITVEYSTDGSTYSTYSTTDSAKINLVSGNGNAYYIGAHSSSITVNDKLRITLNATNMGVYTRLRKLLIQISSNGASGCNVIIEKAMKGSETTFSVVGTYSVSGWSGWNSIPLNAAFGGGSNQTGNIAVLRLTFGITGLNSSYSSALTVSDIVAIGDTYWSYPSTMAKTGHLYSYDSSQNATFPAKVTATSFSGSLSGNATTATTATKLGSSAGSATQPVYFSDGKPIATTYTLGKSVPSDAKFTDTVYTHPSSSGNKHIPSGGSAGQFLKWSADGTAVWAADNNTTYSAATTSAAGLMSASDKTKLDGIATGANKYTLPAAGSSLGGVKTGGDVTISSGVITVNDDSHNHTIANVDGLQTALDVKSDNDHRHYAMNISFTGEDLNNYTDAGTYTFTNASAPANAPSGNTNGWLVVIPWHYENPTIKQLWFRHGAVGTNDFETYVRTKVGSNDWGAWSKFYTTSNPPTASEVGAATSGHNHNTAYAVKKSQLTDDNGSSKLSYTRDGGKNVLTEIAGYAVGIYTIYSQSGTSGNPKDTEAWRYIVHKTGANNGWVLGFGSLGSVFTNYFDGANTWRGWQTIYDIAPPILWMGNYWITENQTVTPSKPLSECRNGWVLVWSDYDADTETPNNSDTFTTVIPKWNPVHVKWSGQSLIAAIPQYLNNSGALTMIGKRMYVHDTKITGHAVNNISPANDVVLRAIYEY